MCVRLEDVVDAQLLGAEVAHTASTDSVQVRDPIGS